MGPDKTKNEQFLLSSFLYGGNAAYIDDLLPRFKADPRSLIDLPGASHLPGSQTIRLRPQEG